MGRDDRHLVGQRENFLTLSNSFRKVFGSAANEYFKNGGWRFGKEVKLFNRLTGQENMSCGGAPKHVFSNFPSHSWQQAPLHAEGLELIDG